MLRVCVDMSSQRGNKTPAEGAETPVHLAIGDLNGATGKFWADLNIETWTKKWMWTRHAMYLQLLEEHLAADESILIWSVLRLGIVCAELWDVNNFGVWSMDPKKGHYW